MRGHLAGLGLAALAVLLGVGAGIAAVALLVALVGARLRGERRCDSAGRDPAAGRLRR